MIDYMIGNDDEIIEITDTSLFPLVDLINTLQADPQEMPFWANLGIPARETVISKVSPDYYIDAVKKYFFRFFDDLRITKNAVNNYSIYVKMKNGVVKSGNIQQLLNGFKNA